MEKNTIYDAFTLNFNNPSFTKMRDTDQFSIYMCKIYCLLGTTQRYIILFTDTDVFRIGTSRKMAEIQWISLQTRNLDENHDIPLHTYQAKRGSILDAEIIRFFSGFDSSDYSCPTIKNLKVTLLHKKNSDSLSYANKGTILSALETYSTIVVLST